MANKNSKPKTPAASKEWSHPAWAKRPPNPPKKSPAATRFLPKDSPFQFWRNFNPAAPKPPDLAEIARPNPTAPIPQGGIGNISPNIPTPSTPKVPGVWDKFAKPALNGLGRFSGALTIGQLGHDALETFFPSSEYTTPADAGAMLYDKMFPQDPYKDRRGKPYQYQPGMLASERDAEYNRARNAVRGSDVELRPEIPSADEFELPPLEGMNQGQGPTFANAEQLPFGKKGKDVNLPLERKPKSNGVLSGFGRRKPLALAPDRSGILDDLPTELEPMEPIGMPLEIDRTESMRKGLTSGHLPNEISMSGQPNAAANGNEGVQQNEESAFNEYFRLANSMPQRNEYKPRWWDRLTAALAGASEGYFGGAARGLQTSTEHINRPYNDAVTSWKAKLDELEPLMEMESRRAMKRDELEYKRQRDQLINQTKTVENEIRRLATEGKIKNDAERIEVMRLAAEIRQLADEGRMEIALQRLEELREYHGNLVKLGTMRASTSASVGASTVKRNEAATRKLDSEAAARKFLADLGKEQ